MEFRFKTKEVVKIDDRYVVVYSGDKLDRNTTTPRLWENVECFHVDGHKLWTVNGMEKYQYWNKKWFVGARIYQERLQLTDFSGNSYDIDLDTGKVAHFEFHK